MRHVCYYCNASVSTIHDLPKCSIEPCERVNNDLEINTSSESTRVNKRIGTLASYAYRLGAGGPLLVAIIF
jgi:hypothetical protein